MAVGRGPGLTRVAVGAGAGASSNRVSGGRYGFRTSRRIRRGRTRARPRVCVRRRSADHRGRGGGGRARASFRPAFHERLVDFNAVTPAEVCMSREDRLAETFVVVSDTLVDDFDLIDFLQMLA